MRLLAVGDVVDPLLSGDFDDQRQQPAAVAAIISCGDLPADYLTFLAERFQAPLFYVHGNHDGNYWYAPPRGCISIDGRLLRWQGIRLLGLGGAPPHNGGSEQYSERTMALRLFRHALAIRRGSIDLVVSHAPPRLTPPRADQPPISSGATLPPPKGAALAVAAWSDPGHRGFRAFGRLIRQAAPRLWLHGHTHLAYGAADRERQVGSTRVVNVYGHCLVEL
ncbi:MAG: metallophosphoesterase family protein [Chloroflexota bacterium]